MQGAQGSQFDSACPELAEGLTVTAHHDNHFVTLSLSKGELAEGRDERNAADVFACRLFKTAQMPGLIRDAEKKIQNPKHEILNSKN